MIMSDFSFIFDVRIREILERDYAELEGLSTRTSTKSTLVISGGIIEGLLLDALIASGKFTFEQACQKRLIDMIKLANDKNILTEDRLTDSIRNYRNLIHPSKEIKDKMVWDEKDAELARTAVDIVVREVRRWAISEQKRRQFREIFTQLSQEEVELLQLFATPQPSDSDQFEHSFLRFSVYRSIESLIAKGVLIKETNTELVKETERISLIPEAVNLIEETVIQGKVQRSSIVLHYSNIAASGSRGSGSNAI